MVGNRYLLIVFCCVFGLVNSVSPVMGYTIDGNSVYIDDSNVYMAQEPHTLYSAGWVTNTLISKQYTGDIDVVFGFDSTTTKPTNAELYSPHNVTEINSYTCESPYWHNSTSNHFWCWYDETRTIYDPITNETTGTETASHLVYDHEYEILTANTISWNEDHIENYINVASHFNKLDYDYNGKDTWYYIKNIDVEAGKEYNLRIYIQPQFYTSGKYDWCVKPSSESLQQAISNGHLYCLDPWWNESFNYTREITITNNDGSNPIPFNYTVDIDFNLKQCIEDGKCIVDGSDVAIVKDDTTEIDRHLKNSTYLDFDGDDDRVVTWETGISSSTNTSVMGWVRWDGQTSKRVFELVESGTDIQLIYDSDPNPDTWAVRSEGIHGEGTSAGKYYQTGGVTAGQWYHFAVVVDNDADHQWFYINGTEIADGGASANIGEGSDTEKFLLMDRDDGCCNWDGGTESISVWDRALTASEISAHYNNNKPIPTLVAVTNTTGLALVWEMDIDGLDNATYTMDSSGNNRNGTITGAFRAESPLVTLTDGYNNTIYFALQENIGAGATDSSYSIYYDSLDFTAKNNANAINLSRTWTPAPTTTLGAEESASTGVLLANPQVNPSSGTAGTSFVYSVNVTNKNGTDTNVTLHILNSTQDEVYTNTTTLTNSAELQSGTAQATFSYQIDLVGVYSYFFVANDTSDPSGLNDQTELIEDPTVYANNYDKNFNVPSGVNKLIGGVHWYGISSNSGINITLNNGTKTFSEFEVPTLVREFESVDITLPVIQYNITIYSGYKELSINNPSSGNWELQVDHSDSSRIETDVRLM